TQYLEDTRETANSKDLVLDGASFELVRLDIHRRWWRRGPSRRDRTGGFVFKFLLGAGVENGNKHVGNLFTDEREGPRKNVHEVRQPVGVGCAVELPD